MSSGAKTGKMSVMAPSLSLIEAASCGSLLTGPFGPFEILSGPLAFGQFFDCRRQNSEPIKIPNPFLFVWNLVSGNRREARSGQPCRLFNHQGGDCRHAVTLAPARDQIQGPSQWIWTATVYSASKILISDRLAVSGASDQDQVCP